MSIDWSFWYCDKVEEEDAPNSGATQKRAGDKVAGMSFADVRKFSAAIGYGKVN
jgi:hypothetical protein